MSKSPLIILASQSSQRQLILKELGYEFEVVPADIDEKNVRADDLTQQAAMVALAKAEAVAKKYPEAIIIAADTFIEDHRQALEKPANIAEARKMLVAQSGREVLEHTGYAYLDPLINLNISGTATTKVKFRDLSSAEIERYLQNEPVLTWSAAFCPAYPAGMALIDSINGSFTGFTHGLPLDKLAPLLHQSLQARS